jgi:MFS family permease
MNALQKRLQEITGGATTAPLLILFVLNLVDEFDQVAFGVLAPPIRDTFGISDATFTRITTVPGALLIMLIVPVGVLADRYTRTRLVAAAAAIWGTMTILTGLSGFIGGGVLALLILARSTRASWPTTTNRRCTGASTPSTGSPTRSAASSSCSAACSAMSSDGGSPS